MTRESLRPLLFPNTALKNRIAAYEQEVEAAVERAAERVVEAGNEGKISRKRPLPDDAEATL